MSVPIKIVSISLSAAQWPFIPRFSTWSRLTTPQNKQSIIIQRLTRCGLNIPHYPQFSSTQTLANIVTYRNHLLKSMCKAWRCGIASRKLY